jgi:adenylate cyclase
MPQERVKRKLAAVLAADVVGYSRLMGADEVGTHSTLKTYRAAVIDAKVAEHNGRVVKSTGDGILADFASVVDSVLCAVEIQRAMAKLNAKQPEHKRLELRIGINSGDVIVDSSDIYGDGVNVAVRIEGLAEPGGVAVSGKVYEEVCEKVNLSFEYSGEHEVKNIVKPISIFRIVIDKTGRGGHDHRIGVDSDGKQSDGPIIAVLPFESLTGSQRWERFAFGISDEIITSLARHPDILVIARNSAFAYKDKTVDVRKIGRELNAQYILEGSVQASGKRLRVTAQLIDTRDGTHVWAERYDRDTGDLFLVQDDIVERVVSALGGFHGEILRSELRKLARKMPASLRAYELYLLGYEAEAWLDAAHTLKAIPLLERAVELDPQFARAWTVLGWACEHSSKSGWGDDRSALASRRRDAVITAARLDPRDPLAVGELGLLRAEEGDIDGAREAFERALGLARNHADALALLSEYVATVLGRVAEAQSMIQKALKLNPNAPGWYFKKFVYVAYFALDFDGVLYSARRCASSLHTELFSILALAQLGRTEELAAAKAHFWGHSPDFDPEAPVRYLPLVSSPALELYRQGIRKAGLSKVRGQFV